MDELKRKANPTVKLLRIMEEVHKEQIITNNLLCRICDLKEDQQDRDNAQHAAWKNAKRKDEQVSKVVVVLGLIGVALAGLALYHDVIKIDAEAVNTLVHWVEVLL
jgi:hypothetical protein